MDSVSFQAKTSDTKHLLNLYVDLRMFSKEVKSFFQTVIIGQRLGALSSTVAPDLSKGEIVLVRMVAIVQFVCVSVGRDTAGLDGQMSDGSEESGHSTIDRSMQ